MSEDTRVSWHRPLNSILTAGYQPMLLGATRSALPGAHLHLACDNKKEIGHSAMDPVVC